LENLRTAHFPTSVAEALAASPSPVVGPWGYLPRSASGPPASASDACIPGAYLRRRARKPCRHLAPNPKRCRGCFHFFGCFRVFQHSNQSDAHAVPGVDRMGPHDRYRLVDGTNQATFASEECLYRRIKTGRCHIASSKNRSCSSRHSGNQPSHGKQCIAFVLQIRRIRSEIGLLRGTFDAIEVSFAVALHNGLAAPHGRNRRRGYAGWAS